MVLDTTGIETYADGFPDYATKKMVDKSKVTIQRFHDKVNALQTFLNNYDGKYLFTRKSLTSEYKCKGKMCAIKAYGEPLFKYNLRINIEDENGNIVIGLGWSAVKFFVDQVTSHPTKSLMAICDSEEVSDLEKQYNMHRTEKGTYKLDISDFYTA